MLLLQAQEVAEVSNSVLCVADELALCLPTVELFALDVREDRGNLAVSVLVGDNLSLAFLFCVRAWISFQLPRSHSRSR